MDIIAVQLPSSFAMLANVIFPILSTPYFSWLFFPVAGGAAVASEVLFIGWRHQSVSPVWKSTISSTIVANVVSWLVGFFISFFMPYGLTAKPMPPGDLGVRILTQRPDIQFLVYLSFGVAFVLSIVIEYFVWCVIQKALEKPLNGLFLNMIFAHVISYTVLILLVIMHG